MFIRACVCAVGFNCKTNANIGRNNDIAVGSNSYNDVIKS